MFELLDDDANRVILLAVEEASALGDDHVRPEHLLLGILGAPKEPALAELVRSVGLRTDRARLDVTPVQPNPGTPAGVPSFDDDAKRALQEALRAARSHAHPRVGPGHLLLAVLKTANDQVRAAVEKHLPLDEFRQRVDRMLGDSQPPPRTDRP